MSVDPRVLQSYLRESARLRSQTARVAPYTAFFSPDSPDPYLNLAIPDAPSEGRVVPVMEAYAHGHGAVPDLDPEYAVVRLKEAFRGRNRRTRVEFVEEASPGLPAVLQGAGLILHDRTPLFAATRSTWKPLGPPQGIRIEPILPTTPWSSTRAYLGVQQEAFGLGPASLPDAAPPGIWPTLGITAGLVATRGAKPVAAGGLTVTIEKVSEISGLASVPSERGQGLSSYVAGALARVGLDSGAELVVLLGSDEGARSAGTPPGFVLAGTLVDWREA